MRKSGWLLALSFTAACFTEDKPEASEDDGGTGTTSAGPSTQTVASDPSASTSMTVTTSTTETSATATTDTPPTSTGETTTEPTNCEGNVADPPDMLCARVADWGVSFAANIAALRKASFDGGADDLLVAVPGPKSELAWVLGGKAPTKDQVDGFDPGDLQIPESIDDAAGDDVIIVDTSGDGPDLQIFAWSGSGLVFVGAREAEMGDEFVSAASASADDDSRVAWLASNNRIDLAPLDQLEDSETVFTFVDKTNDVRRGHHGSTPLLFACKQAGFEAVLIEPMTTSLVEVPLSSSTAIACAVVDVDGDGNSDVVQLQGDDQILTTVMATDELAIFETAGEVPLDSTPHELGAADFDGDGDLDFVVRLEGLDTLRIIWTDDGNVPSVGPRLQLPDVPEAIAAGDFDGDGDADIAYAIAGELGLLALGSD